MRFLFEKHRSISYPKTLKPLTILAWLLVFSGCFSVFLIPVASRAAQAGYSSAATISSAGDYCAYPVSFLNDRAGDITGATAVSAPGFVVPGGLTGEGQIVAVADSGLDAGVTDDIHPDLRSTPGKMLKVVLLKSWAGRAVPDDPDGHGTHMAATIAGTGAASNGQFSGIAPGASIYFQAILNSAGIPDPPADLADLFYPAYSAGARIHVNGWGGGPDSYLSPASQVDNFVRIYPDFLVIFGAGNSGPLKNSITGEGNSKNALVVGASNLPRPAFVPGEEDTTLAAGFSSRGPAGDGRIKPELLAPASAVISARSRLVEGNLPGFQEYTRLQGTSMAAAVAGGSSVLVREYFKKYMNLIPPSAALVKATLINGSRPAAAGPSQEGFGTIDLAGTIIALKEGTFSLADEWAGVSQGEVITYNYHVSDTTSPLKVTLAWTDPPAEPGSTKALVNNIDLAVRTPDGRVYYGNHFLGANTADSINNVEQVYLPAPMPGDYIITVVGTAVRRNTVQGISALLQDFALVWGQPPAEDMVESSTGRSVELSGGDTINIKDTAVVNLVNDEIAPADKGHIFTGAAVFRTPEKAYLTARIWRATGVKVLKTAGDAIITEINQMTRLGGYSLAPEVDEIELNESSIPPDEMPAGVEISAVINPFDQKARRVSAAFIMREGVVSTVRNEHGQSLLSLAGDPRSYRISPDAVYSYEDTYTNADAVDTPFGTGALDELKEVLSGMPIRIILSPSSGEIQYLALKREVALGAVREKHLSENKIVLEDGSVFKVLPGALLMRDKSISSFEAVQPGDYVSMVLLPDTGEAIGLVAFSKISYGKIIDFTRNNRIIYFLDDAGRYRSLYLHPDAVIYRWGVRFNTDAIDTGNRIRIATDPEQKLIWRMDIADLFFGQDIFLGYDANSDFITTAKGGQYRVSGSSLFYKDSYPVQPGDLLPGELVELEYTMASAPTGNVLVSVNARTEITPPSLLVSVVPLRSSFMVVGRISGINKKVNAWIGVSMQPIAVDDAGSFNLILPMEDEDFILTITAVDQQTGGVEGSKISLAGRGRWADYDEYISNAITGVSADIPPGIDGAMDLNNTPLTRAEAAAILARMMNWPEASELSLPFSDSADIPASFRAAVAGAYARRILKGYPDGSFLPNAVLSRAETAVILSGAMYDLGLGVENVSGAPYSDAAGISPWAATAVAQTAAAGIFRGLEDDVFALAEPVTHGEIKVMLLHFLEYCETRY
jgi:subtilisin family serine protease